MRLLPVLLAALLLSLPSCGGGGGSGDDDAQAQQLEVTTLGNMDGVLVFNNAGTLDTGLAFGPPETGDDAFRPGGDTAMFHGLWSFDLSALPAGAQVSSASLRLFLVNANGAPDAAFVLARLDHVDFGAAFPANSGVVASLSTDIAQVSDLATIGPRILDVTAAVLADRTAARTRTQFRLRPALGTNNDAEKDSSVWSSAEGQGTDPDRRPLLILTYTNPTP